MAAADEIHLHASFGVTFRDEFMALKDALFKHVLGRDGMTRIPIILMTATCTKSIIKDIEAMTGMLGSVDERPGFGGPVEPANQSSRSITK